MSAHPTRPQGVVLHHSSHRSLAALTACVLAALGNGASAPYLTVSVPEPMRLEPPPPVPAPFKPAVVKVVTPEETKFQPAIIPASVPNPAVAVVGVPVTGSEKSKAPAAPKFELVPDPLQTKPARMEDILPYFVPPAPAPASKATYEEK